MLDAHAPTPPLIVDDLPTLGLPPAAVPGLRLSLPLPLLPLQEMAVRAGLLLDEVPHWLITGTPLGGQTMLGVLAAIHAIYSGRRVLFLVENREKMLRLHARCVRQQEALVISALDHKPRRRADLVLATHDQASRRLCLSPQWLRSFDLLVLDDISDAPLAPQMSTTRLTGRLLLAQLLLHLPSQPALRVVALGTQTRALQRLAAALPGARHISSAPTDRPTDLPSQLTTVSRFRQSMLSLLSKTQWRSDHAIFSGVQHLSPCALPDGSDPGLDARSHLSALCEQGLVATTKTGPLAYRLTPLGCKLLRARVGVLALSRMQRWARATTHAAPSPPLVAEELRRLSPLPRRQEQLYRRAQKRHPALLSLYSLLCDGRLLSPSFQALAGSFRRRVRALHALCVASSPQHAALPMLDVLAKLLMSPRRPLIEHLVPVQSLFLEHSVAALGKHLLAKHQRNLATTRPLSRS